jgi:hypothetical protein
MEPFNFYVDQCGRKVTKVPESLISSDAEKYSKFFWMQNSLEGTGQH